MCRHELLAQDPEHAVPFDSDEHDTQNGFERRVFGNIYDLGAIFERAHEENGPYIYGPFIFVFKPEVFGEMEDIVILPESIWTAGKDWARKRISTESQVDELLRSTRFDDNIHHNWQYAEISCSNSSIPFKYLSKIIVEPLDFWSPSGKVYTLEYIAKWQLEQCEIKGVPVEVRNYRPSKIRAKQALEEMAKFCRDLPQTVTMQDWRISVSDLPASLDYLSDKTKKRLIQWAKYYTFGTVRAVSTKSPA